MSFKIFPGTFTPDGRKVSIKECKWKSESTRDPKVIEFWKTNFSHKIKFWGIPTGADNGILVLDVDIKGLNGFETIKKYNCPNTMSQKTISGGLHLVYKYPNDGKNYGNRVGFDIGLDIRGEGGYIAHYGLDKTPIADAPQWLLDQALNRKDTIPKSEEDKVFIDQGIINQTINEACENIRNAPEGERNNVLNIEAYRVGQILKSADKDLAFSALLSSAKEIGLTDREAMTTIKSGLEGGSKNAITCPFGNTRPELLVPIIQEENSRWTPNFFTRHDLTNISKLRKPQIFKNWSTEDIHITTADGGTGKTTLKLYEAICLALGESFLGFECTGEGRTLYITGEDSVPKLGAMIGMMMKQMGIMDNEEKVTKVLNSIVVKKDADLCLIDKNKQGFIVSNPDALQKIMEAIEDIRPKLIVFDPIASFWGSESALNDMAKAVSKLLGALVEKSNACVEAINHMGKISSKDKDMSQFAGRGGTGLPSHARVSRVLRPLFEEEFTELTGMNLNSNQQAMICNVNKFSDGSPLYNKPFIIIREGYLFTKLELIEEKIKEEQNKASDVERIFSFIKNERNEKRYPTKEIIQAYFMANREKISKDKINLGLATLSYSGFMGEKIKMIDNPDVEAGGKVCIVTDMEGKE